MIKLVQAFGSYKRRRTSIRMSKLDRIIQSTTAKTNWTEMAKMLFWTDEDRQGVSEKLIVPSEEQANAGFPSGSHGSEQLEYLLILMLIISIAEKRTQETYEKSFSERCDLISRAHDLKDDQYWATGNIPQEWEELNAEFEQRSKEILLDTLREYHQNEIADLVQADGPEEIFNVILDVKSLYLNAIENCIPLGVNYFRRFK